VCGVGLVLAGPHWRVGLWKRPSGGGWIAVAATSAHRGVRASVEGTVAGYRDMVDTIAANVVLQIVGIQWCIWPFIQSNSNG
jgi:hypothetical protein